jgi:rare lipoprotein A
MSFALACAHPRPPEPLESGQQGIASFYAAKFAGRKTASGERYDPKAMTAAHRTLPFGTRVRVERIGRNGRETGSSVEVRINDRGPFVKGRIIDLSDAAARRLGLTRDGIAQVRLQLVSLPERS